MFSICEDRERRGIIFPLPHPFENAQFFRLCIIVIESMYVEFQELVTTKLRSWAFSSEIIDMNQKFGDE